MCSIFFDMKSLNVHFIGGLGRLDMSGLTSFFDSFGNRQFIDSVNWRVQYPASPETSFAIVRSDDSIYVDFCVVGRYLRAVNTTNLSPVAQDSCVEFFISPTSDNRYYNFEFNCIGTVNASVRSRRDYPTRLSSAQLNSILRFPSVGTAPFDEIDGIHSWRLIVAIPLSLIGVTSGDFPCRMTANFYKCGSKTSEPHFLSWNPIDAPSPDFHRTDSFGVLNFL